MIEQLPKPAAKESAKPVAVSLYPSDIAEAERLRRHFDLDSFSQVIRRVIRLQAREIPDGPTSEQVA